MAEENVTRTKTNLQKRSTIEPIFKNSNKQSVKDNTREPERFLNKR